MLFSKFCLIFGCLQYLLFLSGHLFKYWEGSSLLNFSDLIGTSRFSMTCHECWNVSLTGYKKTDWGSLWS